MSSPIRSVCVFCASSEAVDGTHRRVAADLGRAVAGQGWELVYGGGSIGLMGEVARAALAADGRVTGVIPHGLAEREMALTEVDELIRTDTMRQRKDEMDRRSDAFVVLPGGVGTLEELLEIITLKQLAYHDRPIVLLDPEDFWKPLRDQLHRIVKNHLADRSVLDLWTVTRDVAGTVDALRTYRPVAPRPDPAEVMESVEAPPA